MQFKNKECEAGWNLTVENNKDPYGKAAIDFAIRWMNLMEEEYENTPLGEMASRTCREADTGGITGYQYGCAVSLLSQVWIHGEELRRWHNLDAQIGTEGEEANKNGGVLNPAILNIR